MRFEAPPMLGERIKAYLSIGKRFDLRNLDEYRDIKIETGISKNAEGSARVTLGKTEVVVGIKMDVSAPYPDSPDKGNLIVSYELTPMSSSRVEAGPPKFDSIEMGRIIDRGIRESRFIDFRKLCIKEGEKVWNIYIDIYSMNDDGNLLDVSGIAAIAALRDAKIPEYDTESGKVLFGQLTEEKLSLKKDSVFPITVHKIGNSLIVDPNREEEDVSEARISIGISGKIISSVQKGGNVEFSAEEIVKSFELAEKVWEKLNKKI